MKWIIRHTEQIDNIVGKQIVMSFYLFSCLDFILYNHKYILIKFVIKSSIKMLEPAGTLWLNLILQTQHKFSWENSDTLSSETS